MRSVDDLVRDAFQALLRGDTAERDRLCRQAENILNAQRRLEEGGEIVMGQPIALGSAIALPDRSHERLN